MNREKELFKNTFVLSLGKFLPKLVSLVTLPIITAYLTKAEYGTYDLISTLISLVIPIATLQIQSAAFRFLIDHRKDREGSSAIISNIFVVTVPISIVVFVIICLPLIALPLYQRVLIATYFFVDSIVACVGQIARGLGDNKTYSISSVVVSVIDGIGIVCLVRFGGAGFVGVILSVTAANTVGMIFLSIKVKIWRYISRKAFSVEKIKELVAYSWPMVPNNLSTWVLKLSDRLVITAFLGIEANAVYSVANKIPNLLSLAQGVMVAAWHENASIAVGDEDAGEYYSNMLDYLFSLMFGVTVLLIAATPIMFWLLIKGDYAESYDQIPLLILAMFFFVMSSFFGGIYIAHKKTTNVGISTVVAAGINLAIDLCFVNIIGIWAGSISTLVAYAVLYFYRMINSRKFQPVKVNAKKQFLQIALMVIMLFICFMQQTVLNVLNIILGIVLCVCFNYKVIRRVCNVGIKMIRKK